MTELLKLDQVSKVYGQQLALDKVSFSIKKGEICGLVGENGAGKTTLMRILTGLIKESHGQVVKDKGLKIGALIESPALYPNLSAYDNLMYVAKQLGLAKAKEQISEALALVGLAQVDTKKKAKDFSLGMRQRLAIALAILDKPDLLILDEPINGLDPVGIKEMRQIIRKLRDDYQMTVLISSHILSELELVVDRYIIVHKGRVIRELTQAGLQEELAAKLILRTTDLKATQRLLEAEAFSCQVEEDSLILPAETDVMAVIKLLVDHNLTLTDIFHKATSLEDYYLDLLK